MGSTSLAGRKRTPMESTYETYTEDLYRGCEAVAGCRPEADEANAGNRTRTDIT